MLLISHPTGNTFVRALLEGASHRGCLGRFATTVGVAQAARLPAWLPAALAREWERRRYPVTTEQLWTHPVREVTRWAAARTGLNSLLKHETGWACVDAVYRDLDRAVARHLPQWKQQRSLTAVYAYEDGARETFAAARQCGLRTVYELPIAYWETSRRLLSEEAQRWPEWEPTLGATRDSAVKLERKTAELEMADLVVCPSQFVRDSIPPGLLSGRACLVAEFGSPPVADGTRLATRPTNRPLRVLFAGTLTQRKGLADLFAAVRLLPVGTVELVVLGTAMLPLDFYRGHGVPFTYEPPRPHAGVLEVMRTCDLLALPSIVEGRALVQQEAMTCGLPLLITPNTGGEDLVEEGTTGFCVPIRSPERLAEKLEWCAANRAALGDMGRAACRRAQELTWERYSRRILDRVDVLLRTHFGGHAMLGSRV